ncbi:MAG: tripartite tricarboxylate transporter permease [Candidatus Altiarchaeota archaeon]
MIEYLILILIGCVLGTITGLTPGLHVNTLCLLGMSIYPRLGLSPLEFSIAMVSMSLTHTFLDYIPAIFLGVPEEATCLSVLPTHRLLLQGKAMEAVRLTAYGSLLGLVFALLLLPASIRFIPVIYPHLKKYLIYLVLVAVAALIFKEKNTTNRFWATVIFFLSGELGLISLNQNMISQSQILFPVFTGLFGLSTLITSIRTNSDIPPQQPYSKVEITPSLIFAGFLGSIGGLIIGVLPAMSPSQAGVLLFSILKNNPVNFLVCLSAINTSDAIYSLASSYTINNPRSGVATMISGIIDIDLTTLILFISAMSIAALPAYLIHLKIGRWFSKALRNINYRALSLATLAFVSFLIYYLTGWFGCAIAAVSTNIGLLPILKGVGRNHLMGVLIIPTTLYLLSIPY